MNTLQSKVRLGYDWACESFSLLRKKPTRWALLALTYIFVFMLLPASSGFPILLKLVIFISWSTFVAIATGLFREADFGRDTKLTELIGQVTPHIPKLVALSCLSIVYGLMISLITRGDAENIIALSNSGATLQVVLTELLPLLAKFLLLSAPILMATWFAPPLIVYARYSLVHSIKSSLAGCLQHAVTLTVAWLVLTFFMMLGMAMLSVLIAIVAKTPNILIELIAFFSLLVATAWTLAFQYISYRDIFDPVPTGGGEIAM